jgi:hypothetical protein
LRRFSANCMVGRGEPITRYFSLFSIYYPFDDKFR